MEEVRKERLGGRNSSLKIRRIRLALYNGVGKYQDLILLVLEFKEYGAKCTCIRVFPIDTEFHQRRMMPKPLRNTNRIRPAILTYRGEISVKNCRKTMQFEKFQSLLHESKQLISIRTLLRIRHKLSYKIQCGLCTICTKKFNDWFHYTQFGINYQITYTISPSYLFNLTFHE